MNNCNKAKLWALRGIFSTNAWKEIDVLVDEYSLCLESLKDDSLDFYGSEYISPSDQEVKESCLETFDCSDNATQEKIWNEVFSWITENSIY